MHMASASRRIHSGLILAGGLFGLSLSVLILGASRGQATDAGLAGSAATPFTLRDVTGTSVQVGPDAAKTLVLIVAREDAGNFAKPSAEVRQIQQTFASDPIIRVVGVQVSTDTGLLDIASHTAGALRTACPELATLADPDGTVARAYRVTESPTAFVIDDKGVVRGRFPLDRDGAALAIAETVSSVRPIKTGMTGMQLPR